MAERVVIVDRTPGKQVDDLSIERAMLGDAVDLVLLRPTSAGDAGGVLAAADILITWSCFPLDGAAIAGLDRCRAIVCASVGTDHVDMKAARARRLPVCNTPDYGTEEVADHTMALLLGLARRVVALDASVRHGTWDWSVGEGMRRLRGRVLGLVGFGRIGSAVARRAQVFGLDVCFYDPYIPSGVEKSHGVRRVEHLDVLLDQADIISLHTPLTPSTIGMIDGAALARLRPDTLLVNTARGRLVHTAALTDALQAGRLGGAALDVLPDEPTVPAALTGCDRVILTPHAAWYSVESSDEERARAAHIAQRLLRGQPVRDVVDRPGPLVLPGTPPSGADG